MSMDVMGCFDGNLRELSVVGFRLGTFMSICLRVADELIMMMIRLVITM